jgi:hypothetical protein
MGNHHSATEREKEKDTRKEKEGVDGKPDATATSRHEKHRSRTITATPLPPTETKVNAGQTHIINNDSTVAVVAAGAVINGDGPSKPPISSHPSAEKMTSPAAKDKGIETQRPVKQVIEAVKTLDLGKLPPPTVEEIRKQAAETEGTPRFEMIKNVGSETSIMDEDEFKEADKSGLIPPLFVLVGCSSD